MVVWHSHDPVGIASFVAVLILLLFGDVVCVYFVIEYGNYGGTWRTIGMLVTHFLYAMATFAHLRASLSNPGYVQLTGLKIDFSSDVEHTEKPKKKRKREPPPPDKWTVCTKCEIYRPPRSHHCRVCGRCVRRMDHHCPWINNCVGELNFKYFFLFIFYTELLCGYGFALIVADWIQNWHEDEGTVDMVLTICLFFEAVIFGLFVGGMIMAQVLSIACNRSAIEVRRYGRPSGAPKTPTMQLFAAVCGRGNKCFWLLPCIKSRIPDPVPPSDKMSDLHQFV